MFKKNMVEIKDFADYNNNPIIFHTSWVKHGELYDRLNRSLIKKLWRLQGQRYFYIQNHECMIALPDVTAKDDMKTLLELEQEGYFVRSIHRPYEDKKWYYRHSSKTKTERLAAFETVLLPQPDEHIQSTLTDRILISQKIMQMGATLLDGGQSEQDHIRSILECSQELTRYLYKVGYNLDDYISTFIDF